MKQLSIKAQLSKQYTNHSIRATTVTTLGDNDVADRIIMATTNHRSESSLKSYHRRISAKQRREVSDILAREMGNDVPPPPPKVAKKAPSATISNPADNHAAMNIIANNPKNDEMEKNNQEIDDNLNEMQLEEANPDDIDDESLVKMLDEIKKENSHLFPAIPQEGNVVNPEQNKAVLNVQNISNTQNKNQVPLMYFPNSHVVINYNFQK